MKSRMMWISHSKKTKLILILIAIAITVVAAIMLFLPAREASVLADDMSCCPTGLQESTEPIEPIETINLLTKDDLIEDIEYLLTTLEQNFPYFNSIYRRWGTDLLALGHELKNQITYDAEDIDFESFDTMLHNFLAQAGNIGHLARVDSSFAYLLRDIIFEDLYGHSSELWNDPFVAYIINAIDTPVYEIPPGIPVRNRLRTWANPSNPISARIVEDGIAHIRIFNNLPHLVRDEHREQINNFFDEIREFEHLILDLRGNRGGYASYFFELFGEHVLNETTIVPWLAFVMGGERNRAHAASTVFSQVAHPLILNDAIDIPASTLNEMLYTGFSSTSGQVFRISEIILGPNPTFVEVDLATMDYFYLEQFVFEPASNNGFGGKAWLLVDEDVFSAAHIVAAIAKESNFATVVGEATEGVVGSVYYSYNMFTLPNSGIAITFDHIYLVNRYGRPLAYGVEPHHFNHPNIDALGTVLALIAAGEY